MILIAQLENQAIQGTLSLHKLWFYAQVWSHTHSLAIPVDSHRCSCTAADEPLSARE
jgi:hypothetical protein